MSALLRIDASSRIRESHSRQLADYFEKAWKRRFPNTSVVRRDLVDRPVPHSSDATIKGFYTPTDQCSPAIEETLLLSDELIVELFAAETVLIGVPMYNFSVPSALKAYIDHIMRITMRINNTFSFDGKDFAGLVKVKRVFILCAYGVSGYGDVLTMADFTTPYLRYLFHFIGVEDITILSVEGTASEEAVVQSNILRAEALIDQHIGMMRRFPKQCVA